MKNSKKTAQLNQRPVFNFNAFGKGKDKSTLHATTTNGTNTSIVFSC